MIQTMLKWTSVERERREKRGEREGGEKRDTENKREREREREACILTVTTLLAKFTSHYPPRRP